MARNKRTYKIYDRATGATFTVRALNVEDALRECNAKNGTAYTFAMYHAYKVSVTKIKQ